MNIAADAPVEQPIASALEHLPVHVSGPDLALRADATRQRRGKVAAAGSNIEYALSRPRPRHRDGEVLPHAMQAERHEIVHQVVALGDLVEHFADAAGLLVFRNSLVTEIRIVTHDSPQRP